jgi:SAM-dependent methyltransferase
LRLLEGGCGTGEKLVAHAKLFPQSEFCAMDLTPASIDVARFHLKAFRVGNVESIEQANLMHELPFPEETFDVVYSIGVIHHTPDPVAAMRHLAKLVKPDGYLFFWVYGALGQLWRMKRLDYMNVMKQGCKEADVERIARESFREAGFAFSVWERLRSLVVMRHTNYWLLLKSLLVALRRKRAFHFVGLDDSSLYDWFLHAHERFYTGEEVIEDTHAAGLFVEDFISPRVDLGRYVRRRSSRWLRERWESLSPFERFQSVDALALPNEYWWVCRKKETEFSKSVPSDAGRRLRVGRIDALTDRGDHGGKHQDALRG